MKYTLFIFLLLLFSQCTYQNKNGVVVTTVYEYSPKNYNIRYRELSSNAENDFYDTIRWNIGDTLKFKK